MDLLSIIGFVIVIYHLIYFIVPWFLDCDLCLAYKEKFGRPINSLCGKVVWITGASSGIGEHLAYVLANVGCKLILTARREDELKKVKDNCLQGNKDLQDSDIEVIPLDICNVDEHEKALNDVLTKFGKLDILVNNAGRSQRACWEKIDLEVDKQLFDLNVFSLLHLSRLVAKYFLERQTGHLVVTSSLAGISGVPYSASYNGSKHALHGYFQTFAVENIGKGIPVTIVCPGPIRTDFLPKCFTDKVGEQYGQRPDAIRNKVSVERCAKLMAVAIANELPEVWICTPIPLQLTYLTKYYPNVGLMIIRKVGPRFLLRIRDEKTEQK